MRKLPLVAIITATLIAAGPVGAQVRQELQDVRQDARQNVQDIRQGVRQSAQDALKAIRTQTKEERAKIQEALQNKRKEFQDTMQTRRDDAKAKIEAQRTELREKLGKIKDERKRQVVERLQDTIQKFNQNRVEHFGNVIDKIDAVLTRIQDWATRGQEEGRDESATFTAIMEANQALNSARDAVAEQAKKTYGVKISDESALKADVSSTRAALRNDLKAVEAKVKAAHEATRQAATTLGLSRNANRPATVSSTPGTNSP